jgi:hypothetical protein
MDGGAGHDLAIGTAGRDDAARYSLRWLNVACYGASLVYSPVTQFVILGLLCQDLAEDCCFCGSSFHDPLG